MKTRLLIIIGMIIVITISVSSLIIIDYIELESRTNQIYDFPLQRILDNCYAQKNNLPHTQPHMTTTNETYFIDNGNCELEIIEPGNFPDSTYEINRNELRQVLDYCNDTSNVKYGFYNYSNETHSINTKTCEWKEHGTFPIGEGLCVPYIEKWVGGEDWSNKTHYFDTDSCTWKIDQNYDAVNSKGCPQFCPKDDKTILDKFEYMPEVVAFYAKYDDAQASVRKDHISYFAGSDDDALMRMNIFFDENQTITEIDTHCYFQKVHQYEISQEDIVYKLEKYDCKK